MTVIKQTFIQAGDDQQDDPDMQQTLTIESVDSGAGTFVILTTERWALEGEQIDELCAELKAMLKVNVLPANEDK